VYVFRAIIKTSTVSIQSIIGHDQFKFNMIKFCPFTWSSNIPVNKTLLWYAIIRTFCLKASKAWSDKKNFTRQVQKSIYNILTETGSQLGGNKLWIQCAVLIHTTHRIVCIFTKINDSANKICYIICRIEAHRSLSM